MKTESKENLVPRSGSSTSVAGSVGSQEKYDALHDTDSFSLTATEKRFLLLSERGDVAGVRDLIAEFKDQPDELNINCVDPLNRSSLISGIENENIDMIRLLLDAGILVKDALLHAIDEEYVEAVETLLLWEEDHHEPGQPYTWEAVDRSSSTYTPDITPLILAAHRNNYEIIKILLDRGATLPMPHDVRCGCDECITSSQSDSLRHSQSRINAYRALSSSSLIALSSRDPVLTAFELSWELRRLSRMETEFRTEYNEMRMEVQEFATSLLDHSRTSHELEVMLNFNPIPGTDVWEPGDRQTLERLKLAIKYKQKMFVAHPNVQQLLAAIWYDGLPGFRRKAQIGQLIQVAKLGMSFPLYSSIYIMAPDSEKGKFMKKPFVKFICYSSSYMFFLMLLGAASQRIEYLALELIGTPWMLEILDGWKKHERGAFPGPTECFIMLYIFSLVFGEMQALYSGGLMDYISDLWNIVDIISNTFYMTWIGLRATAFFLVQRDAYYGLNPWYPREQWDPFDPMLLSEGVFAAGNIFSFLKLVHIFSINPHLGPLQVSLGRMIIDIIKFFFIYTLVLFAFGCGLNQLLWYYADLEKHKCYHFADPNMPDFDNNEKACGIWRRFANLFETSQSLFWASFGLVDLMAFELQGIKSFTRFWAMLMFGSYSVINIIVLLNMLIAMMSNSYQIISERSDIEWKFARSQLWMSYFEDGGTLPPPFNLCPSMKMLRMGKKEKFTKSVIRRSVDNAQKRHDNVMRMLVRRYVTAEQRKRDDFGITEDDVMEIRQDISTLRYELVDILRNNGMKTPQVKQADLAGKKGKMMERRILKDFQIGIVEGLVSDAVKASTEVKDVFSTIAKAIGNKGTAKENWNDIVRKSASIRADPIGSARNSIKRKNSLRRQIIESANQGLRVDNETLMEYNPKLSDVTKTTRVAFVKFMASSKQRDECDVIDETTEAAVASNRSLTGFTNSIKRVIEDPTLLTGENDEPKPSPTKPMSVLKSTKPLPPASPAETSSSPTADASTPPAPEPKKPLESPPKKAASPSTSSKSPGPPPPQSGAPPKPKPSLKSAPKVPAPDAIATAAPAADASDATEAATSSSTSGEKEAKKSAAPVAPDATAAKSPAVASSSTVVDKSAEKPEASTADKDKDKSKEPVVPSKPTIPPTTERGKSTTTGKTISGWI